MSYAIEQKKRKFERILESLTDTTSSPSRTSLNPRKNASTTSLLAIGSTDVSKRRRVTPTQPASFSTASVATLSAHYLPSSRAAFLDRLETFRNVTRWHIPSTSLINSAEWAKRGWICQDTDTVACPSCKEKVFIDLDMSAKPTTTKSSEEAKDKHADEDEEDDEDPLTMASAIYEGLIKRYNEMIVSAHKDGCPWKRRGCDASIQRIEGLLNAGNALLGLESRYSSIMSKNETMPNVAALPSTKSEPTDEQELRALELKGLQDLDTNAIKLAICGWQRKDVDIVECRHCFRSLGLWLYRGDDPAMERLDAIDSHLEHCPWRSPDAQDTEMIAVASHEKQKLPGWRLVYLAILKDNSKRRPSKQRSNARLNASEDTDISASNPNLSPEQREKKMKDLLRRIRELKKPFNVKSLLKRDRKIEGKTKRR